MTIKSIISALVNGYKEHKLEEKKREARKLIEERERLEAEKKKLETAQKVIFDNEFLVSKQTAEIIKRIFKIYPTNKVERVKFLTDGTGWDSCDSKEKVITIYLGNLVPRCPHPNFDEDQNDSWDNRELSVRGIIYTRLFSELINLIYDIENPEVQVDRKSEKSKLFEQYSMKSSNIKVPGFRKATEDAKTLVFGGTWICSNCYGFYTSVINQGKPHSLDDQYFLKNKNETAYINQHKELYCSKCYEIEKKLAIEEMIHKELNERESKRRMLITEEKNLKLQKTLISLFPAGDAVEPTLIIKEPYLAKMVLKELMKGIDSGLQWASDKLRWPDTCVIYEHNSMIQKSTLHIFYSMASYYHYRFNQPKRNFPKPLDENEIERKKEYWESRLYDDEYYQFIDQYKTEMGRLRSYCPPRKQDSLRYTNHCWNCRAIIDSDFCEKVPGYGYKCNKCGASLKGYS